ncbi:hypothetical protein BU26DRAFT_563536 [Trematosphaeria pertusa]|uniref:O-methyltransferase C-terminal domain-containing protein n=1 Tax=Trematosphaeria pertusa TaxID=390896 RepID=A0A6A6IGT5_9PLEO|nr:uncharacterized protein BU26DRAFT_563536 [Trematosphaeria pertusa]KAF2249631.1 hypothetical protein BU26DRAFT_563536 [Trematosphaeria pertusa]
MTIKTNKHGRFSSRLASAFSEESILLIYDIVLPDSGPTARHATLADMNMMSALASKERSEGEWQALLESAGLRIVKVWKYADETGDSVIVAQRTEAPLGE